ncbi:transposase family protein [Fischerella sp.]|uniref:transposase family protein n=1 Tax=Fischerella sp. TaxID=1191 RepID=UPI0025C6E388|nr:transposase family protein [Fischerella sp.]
MMKKRAIKVLTELLGLKDIKVVGENLYDGIGVILQTQSTISYSVCPHCGTKSEKLHQNHRHIVKDLPWGEKQVFLEINRRQEDNLNAIDVKNLLVRS